MRFGLRQSIGGGLAFGLGVDNQISQFATFLGQSGGHSFIGGYFFGHGSLARRQRFDLGSRRRLALLPLRHVFADARKACIASGAAAFQAIQFGARLGMGAARLVHRHARGFHRRQQISLAAQALQILVRRRLGFFNLGQIFADALQAGFQRRQFRILCRHARFGLGQISLRLRVFALAVFGGLARFILRGTGLLGRQTRGF